MYGLVVNQDDRGQTERYGTLSQKNGKRPDRPRGYVSDFPINAAGSDGRRNTCVEFTRRSLEA
jgi:hypothetical protein